MKRPPPRPEAVPDSDPDEVFINCPFDAGYRPTFEAMIFAIYACGFRPRCALEVDDGAESRLEKIYGIIEDCRYGVHDISRTEADPAHGLPRFNMPLELGIFLGAKRFGSKRQRLKRALVLDTDRFRYQRFISDLSGADIHAHGGKPARAVRCVRDWLANVSRRVLPGHLLVVERWQAFDSDLPGLAQAAGLARDDLTYADFERFVVAWLEG